MKLLHLIPVFFGFVLSVLAMGDDGFTCVVTTRYLDRCNIPIMEATSCVTFGGELKNCSLENQVCTVCSFTDIQDIKTMYAIAGIQSLCAGVYRGQIGSSNDFHPTC